MLQVVPRFLLILLFVSLFVVPQVLAHHEIGQQGLPVPPFATNSLLGPVVQFTADDGKSSSGTHKLNISSFLRLPIATDVSQIVRPGVPSESQLVYLEPHPGTFIFATNSCDAIGDKFNSYALRALRGSLYSVAGERRIDLARGRMLVASGAESVDIHAGAANITLQSGAVAIVETAANGLTRVYSLMAGQHEGAAVMVSFSSKLPAREFIGLMFGQEAVIANHELSEEECVPTDGIERHAVEEKIASSALRNARLFEYSLAQMAEYDELINCHQAHRLKGARLAKYLQTIYEDVLAYASLQEGFGAKASKLVQRDTRTTVGAEGAAAAVSARLEDADSAKYFNLVAEKGRLIAVRNDSRYKVKEPRAVRLEKGTFLVASKQPLKLYVQDKQVVISKGAVGLVQANATGLKVMNLGDFRKNSLQLVSGKHVIDLRPGQELVCTDSPPTLSDVFDIHQLGHRGISSRYVPELGWITSSEVSIKDVLTHHPLVAAMRIAGKHPTEKKVVAHMVKTAAIINLVHPSERIFQQGQPEDETGSSMRVAARCNSCLR
ncbi:MAG: hypothetical protein HY711_02475 [Candidatus Melainabacteria bacterium]|nr:hypothetical protein [Candidatus Melainabacteria bacterium]